MRSVKFPMSCDSSCGKKIHNHNSKDTFHFHISFSSLSVSPIPRLLFLAPLLTTCSFPHSVIIFPLLALLSTSCPTPHSLLPSPLLAHLPTPRCSPNSSASRPCSSHTLLLPPLLASPHSLLLSSLHTLRLLAPRSSPVAGSSLVSHRDHVLGFILGVICITKRAGTHAGRLPAQRRAPNCGRTVHSSTSGRVWPS